MALKMHQPFRAVGKPISATKSALNGPELTSAFVPLSQDSGHYAPNQPRPICE
jgi:hypothetical protein